MRTKLLLVITIFFVALSFAFAQENQQEQNPTEKEEQAEPAYSNTVPSGVDGHVILDNQSTSGWSIIESGGEGVYVKAGMSRIYFEVGGEYYLDLSNLDHEQIPVDIRSDSGDIIISQRDIETPEVEGANISADEDGIRFIMNEDLAERISIFRAAPYPQMVGFISAVNPEAEQEADSDEQEGGETE